MALIIGTYTAPADGWTALFTTYLYTTFIFGALLINLAEEAFWLGLVQRNATRPLGLFKGAALTSIPFAIVHVPITLAGVTSVTQGLVFLGALFVIAPVMRYALGRIHRATGGSLLAAGVFHAAFTPAAAASSASSTATGSTPWDSSWSPS